MAVRDARCALVQFWMASPSARSLVWTSKSAWFNWPVPPPRTHPVGAALIASASGIVELATPVSKGGGADAASQDDDVSAYRPGGLGPPPPRLQSAAPVD